ncbi:UDP-N-acetylmuramoyl-L-alanine--D-glutamate ligase [Pullulanibacillus sp. KACC 23026]|uniref:UDP-N-acetylmuramoyl-L-alanine--D-glutamate ligase n=1 Tax=Pullulanibacillus sp. KACC 23026 TaxID=3028315 RepID=UPI0023AF6B96|nr:UDP-N-acetylmuramoyl-L-alanine--D-glutamate ligase [Pullulanibacillus sp. KACC 23026]WEG11664.1 UDP-N-acetylmuramoyl-L-alanine--D-glutamate ligase [Pullulanibacillus sp. KACC 23026]
MKDIKTYTGQYILVLGLAKSGYAAAKMLHKLGAKVVINDRSTLSEDPKAKELKQLGIQIVDGGHPLSLLDGDLKLIVKNPGIPYSNPLLVEAVKREIPIITEVELAYQLSEAPFIGITGSNGKTTTTMLIGDMLKMGNKKPIVAGNIGTVLTEVVQDATADQVLVAELSSFQLLGTKTFHPRIAVFLNLFDAHLDYHGTKEAYGQAKLAISQNQSKEDYLVYNADDEEVTRLIQPLSVTKVPFSVKNLMDEKGAYYLNGGLYFEGELIVSAEDLAMPKGEHNIANALAAAAAAKLYGVSTEAIRKTLHTFSGVPHRLEYIGAVHERKFYNDSKATNILATSKALSAFQEPIILLAGGLDRGNDFDSLIPYLENVKALVAFGETKAKLMDAAEKAGVKQIIPVDNVEDAVPVSYKLSTAGDVILLSPACASWDQYRSFEERGDMFTKQVHMLK